MTGFLVLESGEIFSGQWLGGDERAAEVVFNTSHSGYEEIATDPSYFGQIVLMTAPMQGNYGVDRSIWESRKIHLSGFLALKMRAGEGGLWRKRLTDFQVPILTELDTRQLTLRLREKGTPMGALVRATSESEAQKKAAQFIAVEKKRDTDWVFAVSRKQIETREGQNKDGPRIAVLDFGCKENIVRELVARSSQVMIFPCRTTAEEILRHKPDGVVLSNGPGDPANVQVAPKTVADLLGKLPIFGICMGHQILGIALGARTVRMKFGHRGSNHPIQDNLLEKIYVSSQNHGYAIDAKTLPANVRVTHTNLNDQSVAGIFGESLNVLGIQYHPESRPGPHDSVGLFDYFVSKMVKV